MRAELINPFVSATSEVFKLMLSTSLTRGPLSLTTDQPPAHEVSGMIGISGSVRGMVMISVDRTTALNAAEKLLGARPAELNADVLDAVGELTNMIVGSAKAKLEAWNLSIGLPTVLCGEMHCVKFPPGASPIVIPFDGDLGRVCVKVGLIEATAA